MSSLAPLRVLLVEDSPTDAKLLVHELKRMNRPIEWHRVETADAMHEALQDGEWHLVVSDWSLPQFSGPSALGVVRAFELDVPFIIVSGTVGEDLAVDAMRAGAHDYVLKDRLHRLVPAVERELREAEDRARRRVMEDALKQSEFRFRRLWESGVIGIAISNFKGDLLEANDAYSTMTGFTQEDIRDGKVRWSDLTPPEFAPRAERALVELQARGAATPWETETISKDGQRIPVLVGVAMLDPDKGVAFLIDLTSRREAEAGRARAEEALRQSEEQLRQAQKMEAIGRLAGGVAHDFNNLLSVILSYSELALSDLKRGDPLAPDIEEIRRAAERAAGLTQQLLMFSRQQVSEPRVINLNQVIGGLEKMLVRIVGEDIELTSLISNPVGRVNVDPTHIEQVILNLVVNARDAMPTGGKLAIETANVELDDSYASQHFPAKPGSYVMVAITDTGCGMDKATQSHIFEPFFTTKDKGKGTGLGLSTVFGIVQQSGGHIWVYSEPGRGTTFKVYLPRVVGERDSLRPPVEPTTLRGTETVLLVEDEEQVRTIARTILQRHGYTVLEAKHAGEAMLLCERHEGTIDLLLTDVVMPHLSGPELAKRLGTTHPTMRVLFMSGYTDDSVVRHGVLEANVAFVQKPITPLLLARKVREVLEAVKL